MIENGMGAIVLEPGTSMNYFVNVRWGTSERPFLPVIPAKGDLHPHHHRATWSGSNSASVT